jgi:hydroxypyruvate reductase
VIFRLACGERFRIAVAKCDPAARVSLALGADGEHAIGLAIGKAALNMARGAGPIGRGLVITNADDGYGVPSGWQTIVASHPVPDERSLAAGDAAIDLIAGARPGERVLALISGGASALCERLAPGVTLEHLNREIGALAASGADIHEINARRKQLSAIKGGKLAHMCDVPITTLAISDVFDDDIATIGSGPTIARRPGDKARVIVPMRWFVDEFARVYRNFTLMAEPMTYDIAIAADRLAGGGAIAWGEPTVRIPIDHGEGGRAQQLALELAKRLRGTDRAAFVAGSDGIDGPPPRDRPAPAGAFVDGSTWDAIAHTGIDPQRALDRCDAGTALAAVGALFVTGPTGINHADVAIVG